MLTVQELRRLGVQWELSTTKTTTQGPRARQVSAHKVRMMKVGTDDAFDVSHVIRAMQGGKEDLDRILLLCVRENQQIPMLASLWNEYRKNKGCGLVVIPSERLDNLSEIFHVALRKYLDCPASTILWNLIHHMHPGFWGRICDKSKAALEKLIETDKDSLTRVKVGNAISEAWTEAGDAEIDHLLGLRNRLGDESLSNMKYNAIVFSSSTKMLIDEDWRWGLTTLLVEDSVETSLTEKVVA